MEERSTRERPQRETPRVDHPVAVRLAGVTKGFGEFVATVILIFGGSRVLTRKERP